MLGGLFEGLLCIVDGLLYLNAGRFVGLFHLREHFFGHGLGRGGELLGLGGLRNGGGIFGQGLFEGFGELLLILGGLIEILLGVFQSGFGNALELGLHGGVVLEFFFQLFERLGGRFVDQLHQLLEGGVLFIELFFDAQVFFLVAEASPGFLGLTVLHVFVVLGELFEGFGQIALMAGRGGERALLVVSSLGLGGAFQGLFGFARWVFEHGDGVIRIALSFAAFFLAGILRIGIATKCFLHALEALVNGFLFGEKFFGFSRLGLGIFGDGFGDFVGLFLQPFDGFGKVAEALGKFGGCYLKGLAGGGQFLGGLGAGCLQVALKLIERIGDRHECAGRLRQCGRHQYAQREHSQRWGQA